MEKYRKIKEDWYNLVLDKPLKGCEKFNIQYIIEIQGIYGVASQKPMTLEEIESINIDDYKFRPLKEVMKEGELNVYSVNSGTKR